MTKSGARDIQLLIVSHLHHHYAGPELSFGRTLEKLIDFFLEQLSYLLLSALLAYGARDVLDVDQFGFYCRAG